MKPLSIAMPYFNRHGQLAQSRMMYDKTYPDLDIEYSICDDGSTPPLVDTQDPKVRLTRLPEKRTAKNPCVPINIAVRNCTREMIVLTNPETEHHTRVLDQMLNAWKGLNDYVMAGCRDTLHGDWYSGDGRSMKGCLAPPRFHYHFCVLFHRELFERIGGFDEDYREGHGYDDNDWLWRLHAAGDVNPIFVPGVTAHRRQIMQRSLWKGPLLLRNEALLRKKWGHLKDFGPCAS